jgi:choline monooxygenase
VGAPIDVAAHLGSLDHELAGWHFETFEHVAEEAFDAEVNWKAAHEAFAESYHFPYVHGTSIIGTNTIPNVAVYDTFGRHHRVGFPSPRITDLPPTARTVDGLPLIYWVYPHLVLAVNAAGVEVIDILPGEDPVSCSVLHGLLSSTPLVGDDKATAGYLDLFGLVHAALVDEDFGLLPSCGAGIRYGQHDHQLIGRNEPAVQNVVRQFAADLDLPLA